MEPDRGSPLRPCRICIYSVLLNNQSRSDSGKRIMKKCPYCAEEIQEEAIKCKHCGEFLNNKPRIPRKPDDMPPWYFRTPFIIFAIASVGPLALPLIWWRPNMSRAWKIGLTIGILLASWLLFQATLTSLRVIKQYYGMLNQL
jgi:zinc-ribbon domain